MSLRTALYDACVLYPAPLRDLLMHLAVADLVHARWTDRIHEEWMRSVLAARPDLRRGQLERTRKLMDAHARDCLVTDYESLIDRIELPDPEDRHVLAAAIRASAEAIVTFNLGDFPRHVLAGHGVEAVHPDDFVLDLIGVDAEAVCAAAKRHRSSLKRPPKSVPEYLAILERQGLVRTVAALRHVEDCL